MKRILLALAMLWPILNHFTPAAQAQSPNRSGAANGTKKDSINLDRDTLQIEEVQISTGYQKLSKERGTGSYDVIDHAQFNRRVGASVLQRLENITLGLSYDTPNERTANNPHGILIRGRNSIYSNVAPLIVVDDFPYDGDLESINPNDVANVTILKDAAAAAQWGARAGNGVIVITTKQGSGGKPTIHLHANTTRQGRPDLWNTNTISASDYIDLERLHFDNGYYDASLGAARNPPPMTPVVELLDRLRAGDIDTAQAEQQLANWRDLDVRDDLYTHFYQRAVRQQYALSTSGSNAGLRYYLSAGLDSDRDNLVGKGGSRFSLRSNTTYQLTSALAADVSLSYAHSQSTDNGNNGHTTRSGSKSLYPYANLVAPDGSALPIARDYRTGFLDGLDNGRILDWKYRPLDELDANETKRQNRDFTLLSSLNYRFLRHFSAALRYQFQHGVSNTSNLATVEAYDTRNQINSFHQPSGPVEFPYPMGGMMSIFNGEKKSHQGRIQLNYAQSLSTNHHIQAFAGWEIKELRQTDNSNRLFGYERVGSSVFGQMDFVTRFAKYQDPRSSSRIVYNPSVSETTDRFLSLYFNTNYNYAGKYDISASLREDAANLFGVATNQRGVPLWSVGAGWNIHEEGFYRGDLIEKLRVRASYGYSGNFSRRATALMTISHNNNGTASISNPPNKELRWEQNQQLNTGIDFTARGRWLSGSVEFYSKRNKDLMAQAPIDPTLGILVGQQSFFFGNVASTRGHGLEGQVNIRAGQRAVAWTGGMRFSYNNIQISEYLMPPPTLAQQFFATAINPIVGRPLHSLYAYRWGGLDPQTGDPRGYLNGELSSEYTNILNNTSPDSLQYFGSIQAPYAGAFQSMFQWKGFSLSFLIAMEFGHHFRRNSVTYNTIVESWTGHSDYADRWQKPGDELRTNVPSFVYRATSTRDRLYQQSEALVLRADLIRLQDIRLEYTLNPSWNFPLRNCTVYAYVSDLNIHRPLNRQKIDPRLDGRPLPAHAVSIGCNVSF